MAAEASEAGDRVLVEPRTGALEEREERGVTGRELRLRQMSRLAGCLRVVPSKDVYDPARRHQSTRSDVEY